MLCGKSDKLLKMFNIFDIQPYEDDQHLASEYLYRNKDKVIIDYTSIIFSNTAQMHYTRTCTNDSQYNKEWIDTNLSNNTGYYKGAMDIYNTVNEIPSVYVLNDDKIFNFKHGSINTTPTFIQSPGKDWNCYNNIVQKLSYGLFYYRTTDSVDKFKKKYAKYKKKYMILKQNI